MIDEPMRRGDGVADTEQAAPPPLRPVTYVEINSPDLAKSAAFFESVFGWNLHAFAAPDYLVASTDGAPGVDAGLMPSRDGTPRTVPVVRVDDLAQALDAVRSGGGTQVLPAFVITGVGRGCYVTDPAGVLLGLHEYDPNAGL